MFITRIESNCREGGTASEREVIGLRKVEKLTTREQRTEGGRPPFCARTKAENDCLYQRTIERVFITRFEPNCREGEIVKLAKLFKRRYMKNAIKDGRKNEKS